jgi:hypothetical protein
MDIRNDLGELWSRRQEKEVRRFRNSSCPFSHKRYQRLTFLFQSNIELNVLIIVSVTQISFTFQLSPWGTANYSFSEARETGLLAFHMIDIPTCSIGYRGSIFPRADRESRVFNQDVSSWQCRVLIFGVSTCQWSEGRPWRC